MEPLAVALEELRRDGSIGAWGISGELVPCLRIRDAGGVPVVLQLRDDIVDPAIPGVQSDSPVITFGVLSLALNRVLGYLAGEEERQSRWSRAVGQDCGKPEMVASLLLQDALDRNASGVVLFSTTRPERVRIAMDAVNTLSREHVESSSLRAFRERVQAELVGGGESHG